ncbi:hypothetical protein RRG08_066964 [Elysia crispata]|uniref:Uncharacterized protein n=1 Tax=Elysia crispata TaxID=231223 RepID=A0AAE0YKN0_9GAST|nr:hypothetical protein RRG08_066964 [Elysia crispata]
MKVTNTQGLTKGEKRAPGEVTRSLLETYSHGIPLDERVNESNKYSRLNKGRKGAPGEVTRSLLETYSHGIPLDNDDVAVRINCNVPVLSQPMRNFFLSARGQRAFTP